MQFLLDTHIFLWFINDMEILSISVDHLNLISSLPVHHKDPFDRLIIAQSLTENLTVITKDSAFDAYNIQKIWSINLNRKDEN
jgi:PIN domain nuclease of toxin-antitoxin system